MSSHIAERHKHRHSHGDTTPTCKGCNLYLSAEEGQNRVVCPRCGKPNHFYKS